MNTLERLVVELATDATEYQRGLAQASSSTSNWGGKLAGIAGKAALGAVAAAGAAIAGVGVAGVKEFVGFQNSMNEVFTLLPGMSADAMGKMQEDVKSFAKEFGVLPKETVPALYQAISAGVPQDNVFDFLETAQKAARGGVTSLETAVDGISSTVNAYGSDVLGAAEASDLMFTAVKLGKTNFEQLSASLYNVVPTAQGLGVGFDTVTAALASMTAQGVPTSVATTQLRQLFVELSKAGGKTATLFEEMAGKSFREFIAEGGNTQQALQMLEQHAGSTGVGINDLFGSVEAGNAALALTGKGTEKFSSDLAAMGASTGATQAAFEQMNGGIGASLERLSATWNTTLLDVGEKAAPAFAGVVDVAEKVIPVVGDAFVWAADAVVKASAWIQDALTGTQGKFSWVSEWVAENLPLMRKTVETVLGAISAFWETHGSTIMRIVGNFMGIVTTIFDTYLKNAFDIVKLLMQLITGDFEGAGETLKGIARRTFEAIFTTIGFWLDSVRTLIGDIDWAALGTSIIEGIVNGVKGAAYLLAEAARGAADGALNGIKDLLGIHSPSKVMAVEVGGPMAMGVVDGFDRQLQMSGFGGGALGDVGGGASYGNSTSTNYFTFNISAGNAGEAKVGVLGALRQAGVAFA